MSEATITRFAKAIGYCSNVRDMKIKLAQTLTVGQRFILEPVDQTGYQGIYEINQAEPVDINPNSVQREDVEIG